MAIQPIDFSKGLRGPVRRPKPGKTRITIRIDNDILNWFRARADESGGGNYQTMINAALRGAVERASSGLSESGLERDLCELLARNTTDPELRALLDRRNAPPASAPADSAGSDLTA